jgi:hypothetical protein
MHTNTYRGVMGKSRTPRTGGMEDSIGDGRRSSHNADFAQALTPSGLTRLSISSTKMMSMAWMSAFHRHVIFAEVRVRKTPEVVISQRLLVQSHADTPDDPAKDLATRRFGVEDAAGSHGVDHACHANDAQADASGKVTAQR